MLRPAYIGFALVPNHTFDGQWQKWFEHLVVEYGRKRAVPYRIHVTGFDVQIEPAEPLQRGTVDPCLRGGAPVCRLYEAYRDVEQVMQLLAENVTHDAEFFHIRRICRSPRSLDADRIAFLA